MVYAFILHTILPGKCTILYSSVYGQEPVATVLQKTIDTAGSESVATAEALRQRRKEQFLQVAQIVQSEYLFRNSINARSFETALHMLNNEGRLPDFELGFCRLPRGEPFETERVAVWLAAMNTGFTLVCEPSENRILAESALKLIIKHSQSHCKVLSQPTEVLKKVDRMAMVVQHFLPGGQLLPMNHRVARQFEKELEMKMKS